MWWRNRSAALLSFVLVTACARLNPSFGEGDAEGGTDGDSASSTVGTTRGSDSDVASDTRDADSNSNSNPSETAGSMSETDPTGDGTTRGDSSDTGAETDTEAPITCSVAPGPTSFCNTVLQGCQGGTCAPWSSEIDGDLEGTFCLPAGTRTEGQNCEPICSGLAGDNCGPGLVCDIYSGDPQCRPTCSGFELSCNTGICLRYYWEDEDGEETIMPLSLCKGECDPSTFELNNVCEIGDSCVLDEEAGTVCVPEEAPVAFGGDCSESACAPGLICVSSDVVPECEHDDCCYQACSFAAPVCAVGSCTTTIDVPFADEISVGFCPPQP